MARLVIERAVVLSNLNFGYITNRVSSGVSLMFYFVLMVILLVIQRLSENYIVLSSPYDSIFSILFYPLILVLVLRGIAIVFKDELGSSDGKSKEKK